jgi:hypothetical protein
MAKINRNALSKQGNKESYRLSVNGEMKIISYRLTVRESLINSFFIFHTSSPPFDGGRGEKKCGI